MNKDNLLSRVIALQLQSARFEIVPTKFPIHPIVGTNSICAIYEEIFGIFSKKKMKTTHFLQSKSLFDPDESGEF